MLMVSDHHQLEEGPLFDVHQVESVEARALHKRGWTISAIARHLGRNRRTVPNYLNGVTEPGVRKKPEYLIRLIRSSTTSPPPRGRSASGSANVVR